MSVLLSERAGDVVGGHVLAQSPELQAGDGRRLYCSLDQVILCHSLSST
jgi:hypothetical protein